MKTRSAPAEPPNIAASVKARRTARIGSPSYRLQSDSKPEEGGNPLPSSANDRGDEPLSKSRQANQKSSAKDVWTADDRRLFFQGVRLYGRNFNELACFIRLRGHRIDASATSATANQPSLSAEKPPQPNSSSVGTTAMQPINMPSPCGIQSLEGRTKEQVRLFYRQTWHKLRRYIKFPDEVPERVREVYAIVNWSVMRFRIKKALDNRLGEKLNELVHYGSTCVKHNGRRFLLKTPVCPALKQLNNIYAPTQEFSLPDDVWLELVPSTQTAAWRVLEAEQNPRLRLRVDINRQLSDVISLAEAKWILPNERIRSLLCLTDPKSTEVGSEVCSNNVERLLLRFPQEQRLDGAISLQEVSRTRSADIALKAYIARRQTNPSPSQITEQHVGNAGLHRSASATAPTTIESALDEPTQACNAGSIAPSSSVVRLDLSAIGRQLSTGITFEEARDVKLIVIFLALGCPVRIRFEYVFLPAGHTKGPAAACTSNVAVGANGEGISNGLRRLLHLNACEYLNFKNWNQPTRGTTSDRTAHSQKSTDLHTAAGKFPSSPPNVTSPTDIPPIGMDPTTHHELGVSEPSTPRTSTSLLPQTVPVPPIRPEATIAVPVSAGHEVLLVRQWQNPNPKMVVARQLDVHGSASTSIYGSLAVQSPQMTHHRPLLPLPTSKVPIPPLHSTTPAALIHRASSATNSLLALHAFSRNQARRARRQRYSSTHKQRISTMLQNPSAASVSSGIPKNPQSPLHSTVFANTGSGHIEATSLAQPGTLQPNHGEATFPFSLDGYSNTSTTDSLKSLLNAFMANAPPGLELITPKKEIPQAGPFSMASPSLLNFGVQGQTTTDMPHQEDSLSTFINTLTTNGMVSTQNSTQGSTSYSLTPKMFTDVLQTPGETTVDPLVSLHHQTSESDNLTQLLVTSDVDSKPDNDSQAMFHPQPNEVANTAYSKAKHLF